jgi:hypothetical protein
MQAEDTKKHAAVMKMICSRIHNYEEQVYTAAKGEAAGDEECPTPFAEGYRCLLASVLVNTGAHVVSAPLARYSIMNSGHFQYSHEFACILLAEFLDKQVKASGDSTYFKDQMKNYLF